MDLESYNLLVETFNKCDFDSSLDGAMLVLNELSKFFKENHIEPELETIINLIYQIPVIENSLEIVSNNTCECDDIINCFIQVYLIEKNKINNQIFTIDSEEFVDDSVRTYFNEIARYPLLSREEERIIGYRLKNGDTEARRILIERNLRLVVSVAKAFKDCGLSILDLIQEGNLGLISAVDKFDVTKDYRFSSFAIVAINRAIVRGIENNIRTIRIPVHMHRNIRNYLKLHDQYNGKLTSVMSNREIALELGITTQAVALCQKYIGDTVSFEEMASLEDSSLLDFFPADVLPMDEVIVDKSIKEAFIKAFMDAKLTKQQIKVLTLRYGLYDGVSRSLSQVGEILGTTKENIRGLESRAFNKLRENAVDDNLIHYTSDLTQVGYFIELFLEILNKNLINRSKDYDIDDLIELKKKVKKIKCIN